MRRRSSVGSLLAGAALTLLEFATSPALADTQQDPPRPTGAARHISSLEIATAWLDGDQSGAS